MSADARAVMVLMAKPAIEAGGQVTVERGRVTALDSCGSLVNAKRVSTTPLRTCVRVCVCVCVCVCVYVCL